MTWGRGSTRSWRALRSRILARDPLCQLNLTGVCAGRSTQVDHIINVASGGTDHPSNLRGVCKPCHDQKTQGEAAQGRRKGKRQPAARHPGLL